MNALTDPKPGFWLRAVTCTGCSLLFALLYNITNHMAGAIGQEHLVNTWFAEWELKIPLVPVFIVPYWSIDLLFIGGFLLCSSRQELQVLSRRIIWSICLAALFFTFMPLRLGFERSTDQGIWSPLFAILFSFDQVHNLFPSLHVTFAIILRWTYARHLHGCWRAGMHVWFLLITTSTVLVHQHHLIDILGGGVLGLLVMYLIDEPLRPDLAPRAWRSRPAPKIALTYGLGASLFTSLGFLAVYNPWHALWFWPAFSLACVSLSYAGLGSHICRPRQEGPSIPARILLLPWLELVGWSRRWWWRDGLKPTEIADGIWIGRVCDVPDWQGAVIDCTCEHRRRMPKTGHFERIPMMDLVQPEDDCLQYAAKRVEKLRQHGRVLVVCGLGMGRSAAVVREWLVLRGMSQEKATKTIATKRKIAFPSDSTCSKVGAFSLTSGKEMVRPANEE